MAQSNYLESMAHYLAYEAVANGGEAEHNIVRGMLELSLDKRAFTALTRIIEGMAAIDDKKGKFDRQYFVDIVNAHREYYDIIHPAEKDAKDEAEKERRKNYPGLRAVK